MKPDNRTKKRILGDIGERIASEFLRRRGFKVLETNYLRKWGEIDIVAQKGKKIHFIEVKSVSCKTPEQVTQETYRPEENMHPAKLQRLGRTIQTYLLHKKLESDWQLDLITVKIDQTARQAKAELVENIVI